MGAYLSKPVTDKEFENGEDDFLSFVTCSMQGWRTSQEDSHSCIIDFAENMSCFAVYDGHGGAEVAQLCSDKLPQTIKSCVQFTKGNFPGALIDSFLSFDESILTSEVQDVLKKLANIEDNKSNGDEDEEDDPSLLQEEATLPLSQLLKKYKLNMIENNGSEEGSDEGLSVPTDETVVSTTSNIEGDLTKKVVEESYEETLEDDEDDEFVVGDEEEEDSDEEESCEEEEEEDECGREVDVTAAAPDYQYMHSSPGYDSGSTAVVAIVDRGAMKIHVANAGDSRCVLCRGGRALDLSVDHKPEDELESARITKAGGVLSEDGRVNGGLNLSRSIGDHSYKRNEGLELKDQMISALPDVKTVDLRLVEDEFLVLACDGIWNTFSSEELVEFIKKRMSMSMDLKEIISEIFSHCLAPNTAGDGTGCDNMTCIIVVFKNSIVNNNFKCNGNVLKRKMETSTEVEGDEVLVSPPKIIKAHHQG